MNNEEWGYCAVHLLLNKSFISPQKLTPLQDIDTLYNNLK